MNRFDPVTGLPASGGEVKACGEPGRAAVSIRGPEGPMKQELGRNYFETEDDEVRLYPI